MTDERELTTEETNPSAAERPEAEASALPGAPAEETEVKAISVPGERTIAPAAAPPAMSEEEKPDNEPHTLPPVKNKKKAMRKFWLKTVFMLALIGVSIGVMFGITNYVSDEKTMKFSELIRQIKLNYFLIFLAAILFYIIIETAKYAYMLKISTGRFRMRVAFKTMFLGKYYDGITPMSTGGQPFQIYYLHKKHIPKGAATAIPLIRYLISALCVTIISIVLLIIAPNHLEKGIVTTTMYILSWVSIALNCLFPLVILFFTIFPRATKHLIAGIISLLAKMHLVKHKYLTMKRWIYELNEYSRAIKEFTKKLYELVPVIILSGFETLTAYAIPFFTVIAFTGIAPTEEFFIQILCLSMLTRYTALLVPTPGNTGAVEASGYLVFTTVAAMAPAAIGWIVLVWRLVTYYMYILSGIGINIFEIIRSAVRNKRAMK